MNLTQILKILLQPPQARNGLKNFNGIMQSKIQLGDINISFHTSFLLFSHIIMKIKPSTLL